MAEGKTKVSYDVMTYTPTTAATGTQYAFIAYPRPGQVPRMVVPVSMGAHGDANQFCTVWIQTIDYNNQHDQIVLRYRPPSDQYIIPIMLLFLY